MAEAIGIRLEDDFLREIDNLSNEEAVDRSTILRKLLNLGYHDFMKEKAKEGYLTGKVTISEAAKIAGVTIWEIQKYLIESGYKSEYSITDLEADLRKIK